MDGDDRDPARGNSAEQSSRSYPIGATIAPDGVNFSVYARNAGRVELLLFDSESAPASQVFSLDPIRNRSGNYWHVFVPGIGPGQLYGYRVCGTDDPRPGCRFDPRKVLLDPYGRLVAVPDSYDRKAASSPGDTQVTAMKSVVVDVDSYDWEDDAPPAHPYASSVFYELHVGGFTRHPNSGVPAGRRGTYAGLIDKIPYLAELGITAVELLPVFQFDPYDAPPGRENYWGYAPVSFFAPHAAYSSNTSAAGVLDEFRDMVKALHRAGIEVILDVVFNHTTEGDSTGPTLCFRGLDNPTYYILEGDTFEYANYTGTGNTLNSNHSVVRRLIVDSLHYWVEKMHVDGFRFDLASVLFRDEHGRPQENPPIIWEIDSDPILAGAKLIAEAWDAAGLYHVGSFAGDTWKEWNGQFRDDVRRFLRGDKDTARSFALRMVASPDLYGHEEREPEQSVNFVTCHDGFTLNDLVTYSVKNNLANGEDNRDGTDDNFAWNCGVEGPTDDEHVNELRNRQVKNFLAVTLLALGTPMLLMGDEVRRTQHGNNNAYCQDNELGWFDWSMVDRHGDIFRFTRMLIEQRRLFFLRRGETVATLNQLLAYADIQVHGVKLGSQDWGADAHALAYTARSQAVGIWFHIMVNAYREALEFEIPPPPNTGWKLWIDTSRQSPEDCWSGASAPAIDGSTYVVPAHSLVALSGSARR